MAARPLSLHFTPLKDIPAIIEGAKSAFRSGKTKPLVWRVAQLKALLRMVQENQDAMVAALQIDLKRPEFESVLAEIMLTVSEVKLALAELSTCVYLLAAVDCLGDFEGRAPASPDSSSGLECEGNGLGR